MASRGRLTRVNWALDSSSSDAANGGGQPTRSSDLGTADAPGLGCATLSVSGGDDFKLATVEWTALPG
jgi:hypothetical protein